VGKPLNYSRVLANEQATEALGMAIAAALPEEFPGWSILLQGDLGAGKSTLARAMLHALGHTGRVPSPTYTLVEPYSLPRGDVYHIDLYRIGGEAELEFLGWSDLHGGLKLIEWPERVPSLDAVADLKVRLAYEGEGRNAELAAMTPRGHELLVRLSNSSPNPVAP
jgi:tRNA threonylcarbamoyladenosine biosynthesis protein TsaE